jgi:hypothetical protein
MSMAAVAFAFRGWCLWRLDEYNMVVNQLANFLDVYAMGMGASILYVRHVASQATGDHGSAYE